MKNKKLTTSLVAGLLLATNLFSQELSTIIVTSATKSDQSIQDVTSNVEVITKEEIEERKFTSVIEALNTISGISFKSHGSLGSSSSVFLRGMDNHRTLVLIDGVRYQDPSNTSGANLSHIMMNDVERIEVIKGAQSGIWGADASSGVINIITKKSKKGTSGNLNLELGSFKTKKYGTSISHGTEKFDLRFSANKIETDGFSNATPFGEDPKDYERDGYTNTTLSLDTNYYISDESKISFNVKDINGLAEYDKSKSSPDDESRKSDINVRLYNLAYFHKVDMHKLKLKYQLSKFNRHEIGTTASAGFTFNGTYYPGSENVLRFNGKTQNLELSDEISYSKNDFLLLGLGINKDDVDYEMTDNSFKEDDSKGKYFYATNSNKFEKVVLTQSLRYDAYKNFDNELTGKVGIKYDVNSDLSFTSNIATGYNVPSIMKELNPWGKSNPDLEPEKTKSFDIGLNYKDLSLTFFKSKVDNLIDWKNGGYENIKGESNFKGVELGYKKALSSDILLNLSYTHLSAKDSDDERLIRRPKRKLNVSVDYYGIKNLHINVNSEYIGDRIDSSDIQTGNYMVWNSVFNYDINKNLSSYIKFDNIFNKYYQSSYGYSTAPRSAYIGLKYKF